MSHLSIYEKAITTHRAADTIARVHGYENASRLAESLPLNAHVIDVGAGASPFGKVVAELRPDITWINFDYSYNDPVILREVGECSPPNLTHAAGDATRIDEQYRAKTFDAIFSYWLLPHLSIDDELPARKAAKGIFALAKTNSPISVGPKIGKGRAITLRARPALQVIKDSSLTENNFVDTMVHETQLRGNALKLQRIANDVATPYFGTTRYAIPKGKLPHIYHPPSQEYVSPISRNGLQTLKGLARVASRHEDVRPYVRRAKIAGALTLVAGISYGLLRFGKK